MSHFAFYEVVSSSLSKLTLVCTFLAFNQDLRSILGTSLLFSINVTHFAVLGVPQGVYKKAGDA